MLQFVVVTQPINALAFVFDGLHYGASDFEYAAVSMVSAVNHNRLLVCKKGSGKFTAFSRL